MAMSMLTQGIPVQQKHAPEFHGLQGELNKFDHMMAIIAREHGDFAQVRWMRGVQLRRVRWILGMGNIHGDQSLAYYSGFIFGHYDMYVGNGCNIHISHYHGIWEFHIHMGVSWSWYSSILKVSSLHGIYNKGMTFFLQPAWSG